MKRILSALIAAILILALGACGNTTDTAADATTAAATTKAETAKAAETKAEEPAEDENVVTAEEDAPDERELIREGVYFFDAYEASAEEISIEITPFDGFGTHSTTKFPLTAKTV
jgi:hypothetical protein